MTLQRLNQKIAQASLISGDDPPLVALAGRQADARESGPHHHATGQLIGLLSGLLSVRTRMGAWVLPTTRAVWIPPSHLHAARSHGPFEGWAVYVAAEACGGLPRQPQVIEMTALLREAVLRAAEWDIGPLRPDQKRVAGVILDEIGASAADTFMLPMPQDVRLQRIAGALVERPDDARTLEQWAQWAHLAPRTLSRRFVDETGLSFTAWRQRARLLRALELLAAGESVTAIALELGYDNASAFIALFRRTFGVTPGRYLAANLPRI
ncbi:helix-turn-helix transcriptional regulator [Herbaspirillum sp. WKF16]|uniref:AraC family transcriptional regulator n=1 Tax=Herbaspirillum sp. WKF16 TaxID=3028312 RepID=UPI0023A9B1D3|nr:helix-turn-helix transcriptional regulator [Herbaspirillum sp. WKF16]WDZ95923.1 helix-turn-helix transcriptional regulator [Herbaspirillum sp. WKF16]